MASAGIVKRFKAALTADSLDKNVISNLRHSLLDHSLTGVEVDGIAKVLSNFKGKLFPDSISVGVFSSLNASPFISALRISAFREGLNLEATESSYSVFKSEFLSPSSKLSSATFDVIILDEHLSSIDGFDNIESQGLNISSAVADELGLRKSLWQALINQYGCKIIQHTFVPPSITLTSLGEKSFESSSIRFCHLFNESLCQSALDSVYFLDLNRLSEVFGQSRWLDKRLYYAAAFPISIDALPLYSHWLGAVLRQIISAPLKALVLDFDNTLWGGVIGEDGLEGIELGLSTPQGQAFLDFCKYVKSLARRGVILCAASKNSLEIALEVFDKHPSMLLGRDDFASIKCSWGDKATSILEICKEVNIDPSSVVFCDDSLAECELVRSTLPDVRVVHLDPDVSVRVDQIDNFSFFHSQEILSDDFHRSESYTARQKAVDLLEKSIDYLSYLKDLDMRIEISKANNSSLPRVVQMESKTNQFNLSTRRLGLSDLNSIVDSRNALVCTVGLQDKFASHGLISYFSIQFNSEEARVTDWLMSCRVFSRDIEFAVLDFMVEQSLSRGCSTLRLLFKRTSKNSYIKERLELISDSVLPSSSFADGFDYFVDLNSYDFRRPPIEIFQRGLNF